MSSMGSTVDMYAGSITLAPCMHSSWSSGSWWYWNFDLLWPVWSGTDRSWSCMCGYIPAERGSGYLHCSTRNEFSQLSERMQATEHRSWTASQTSWQQNLTTCFFNSNEIDTYSSTRSILIRSTTKSSSLYLSAFGLCRPAAQHKLWVVTYRIRIWLFLLPYHYYLIPIMCIFGFTF